MSKPFYFADIEDGLTKLVVPDNVLELLENELLPRLEPIEPEAYWKKYALGMLQHAPKGYILYDDSVIWVQDDGDLRVVEFRAKGIRAFAIKSPIHSENNDADDSYYDLVYMPWDWLLEEDGKGEMCSKSERKSIRNAIGWTNELHEKLEKLLPMSETRMPRNREG